MKNEMYKYWKPEFEKLSDLNLTKEERETIKSDPDYIKYLVEKWNDFTRVQ